MSRVKRIVLVAVVLFVTGALLGACLEAARRPAETPNAGISSDPSVDAILARSCQNCHSDRTEWPWYSRIPPVGAAIRKDVSEGRALMDFSRWAKYGAQQKSDALTEIAALVRNRQMPPGRYTLLHPSARLSDDDIRRLVEWTREERHRIGSQAGVN